MFTAACCLFSLIGAWLTWRHNPFYSLKSTVRTFGLTLLMLGAAAGMIALTVRFTDGRSLAAQGAALALAVMLCTLGLILGISAVSTPAGARLTTHLPANVPVVSLYRARILPWVRGTAVVLGGCLLLMLVPGPVRYIAGSFAGIGAFLGVIMLATAYVTALRVDRAITALQLDPWLHWHYPPQIWESWIARLADPRSKSRRTAPRLMRRLQAASPDTYFGHDGVFCNGEFCTWLSTDVYLLSASVEPGPPRCIELWFQKILPGAYGGPQVTKVRKEVLIAADAGASDLPALQAALVARCPGASINLA